MVLSLGPGKYLFSNYLSIYCTRGTELDAGAGHTAQSVRSGLLAFGGGTDINHVLTGRTGGQDGFVLSGFLIEHCVSGMEAVQYN